MLTFWTKFLIETKKIRINLHFCDQPFKRNCNSNFLLIFQYFDNFSLTNHLFSGFSTVTFCWNHCSSETSRFYSNEKNRYSSLGGRIDGCLKTRLHLQNTEQGKKFQHYTSHFETAKRIEIPNIKIGISEFIHILVIRHSMNIILISMAIEKLAYCRIYEMNILYFI